MKKNGTLVLPWATTIAVERRREGPIIGPPRLPVRPHKSLAS
ncbi:hypothetical protein [Acetobacter senegalensis]|nr:hypothetical protein [Acetobacter senegalensis]MDN7354136.1 hypothetical protein [Acetobacter senegalensis]